ncbi:MAG: hypothetical protein MJA82_09515 [Clostridia bacterium]|nr:hypothetical protein [Clostridia bacterium]
MTKLKEILKNRKGNGAIYACIIVLVLMLLFTVISEYLRLHMIAKGVRDALQSSIISVATENYDDLYNGLREGYSGAYELSSNGRWESNIDTGSIYYHLDSTLGLRNNGRYHIKISGGDIEFKLSRLDIEIINSPLAPNTHGSRKFLAKGKILLEVPLGFGWGMLPPMKINLGVMAGYTPKF